MEEEEDAGGGEATTSVSCLHGNIELKETCSGVSGTVGLLGEVVVDLSWQVSWQITQKSLGDGGLLSSHWSEEILGGGARSMQIPCQCLVVFHPSDFKQRLPLLHCAKASGRCKGCIPPECPDLGVWAEPGCIEAGQSAQEKARRAS